LKILQKSVQWEPKYSCGLTGGHYEAASRLSLKIGFKIQVSWHSLLGTLTFARGEVRPVLSTTCDSGIAVHALQFGSFPVTIRDLATLSVLLFILIRRKF
jgi:hypothetical protein